MNVSGTWKKPSKLKEMHKKTDLAYLAIVKSQRDST